jgi:hypothetical protein
MENREQWLKEVDSFLAGNSWDRTWSQMAKHIENQLEAKPQFAKLSFAKNLTPLLRSRKIDFALIFAVSENQLNSILQDIMPAMKEETRLWVAHPKITSKIVTDLNRESSWHKLTSAGYEGGEQVTLDHVWVAVNFKKNEEELISIDVIEELTIDMELTKPAPIRKRKVAQA